jgi:hypothetical protein
MTPLELSDDEWARAAIAARAITRQDEEFVESAKEAACKAGIQKHYDFDCGSFSSPLSARSGVGQVVMPSLLGSRMWLGPLCSSELDIHPPNELLRRIGAVGNWNPGVRGQLRSQHLIECHALRN